VAGVVHRAGEGEKLFGGRIVLKAAFEQLCITESWFSSARDGASPHIHRLHVDSFYVLEGELAVLVDDEEVLLGAGAFASAPPELVHGFRTTMPTRFLNFHTPDGGFAENLRDRNRGGPGGFDSFDVPPASGRPGVEGVVLGAGEGERLETGSRVATIKAGRDELSLIEFELKPGFEGPDPHEHAGSVDSFYVLEGEVEFEVEGEQLLLGPGSFVGAAPGVEHTFGVGPGPGRLLNIHAPSGGFHDWLRKSS
jgi:quercetin dioxygenase-like cupin family protein